MRRQPLSGLNKMIDVKRITLTEFTAEQIVKMMDADDWEDEGHTESVEHTRAFLEDEDSYLLLAFIDDYPVGMLTAFVHRKTDERGQDMYVDEVETKSEYRKQGVGKALMYHMIELAKQRGCSELWLATEGDNDAANALYKNLGIDSEVESKTNVYSYPLT